MREVNLLPQERQHHLGTPAAVEPSLQAPPALRLESIGLRGLGHRAHADLIAAAPLVDGFSKQQELVGGQGARANSLFGWEAHSIRGSSGLRIITCYLNC